MKNGIFLGIILTCALLQATILNSLSIFYVKPDLLFISVIGASIFLEAGWAIFLSIIAGILKDVFCPGAFGINTILFGISSLLVIRISKKITLDNNLIRAILAFIIIFLNNTVAAAVLILSGNPVSWGVILRVVILESLYTALILPLILPRLSLLL